MLKTDVVVIGAGAVGSAVARELSKYNVNVIVVEKNEDVGGDASKSNSAIIHTGYDAAPGTLESQLVVAANPMYDEITRDLDVPFSRIGAILPAITDEQFEKTFEFTIPPDAMHSFDSLHNRISWRLDVCGEVEGAPPFTRSYVLVVNP